MWSFSTEAANAATSTHFRFASKADVNPRSRMSRRANSDSTPFNPVINQGCGCGRYSLSRRALSLGGIAMPFVSLMRQPFIRIAVVTVSAIAAVPALAQSAAQWPERPVQLLVTVGAGGAADTLSRNLSNGFQQFANGQPLIVENRPGAGGTIAAAAVAREKPDGYTLFLAEVGPNAVSHTLAKLPYDPHTAFTPIIHAANLPAVILIRPTLPHVTLSESIAAAKEQPRKFNYASAGLGNWTHLFMAYLNNQAGIDQDQRHLSFGCGNADVPPA